MDILQFSKIAKLQQLFDYHQNLYDTPDKEIEISDGEFDQLVEQLRVLAPEDPRLSKIAGGGHEATGFVREKVSHADNPCYSLAKVYTFAEVVKFAEKVARSEKELFNIEVKFDGLTGSLTNGVLSTSGEGGLVGVDISDKLSIIDFDVAAPGKDGETLRGEIVIKKSIFEKYRHRFVRKNGEPYKVSRSAAVASVMNEKHVTDIGKYLTFVAFGRFQKAVTLAQLREFPWDDFAQRVKGEMDYPADGLVLKLADEKYLISLGATSHHRKGEIAFKFGNPTGSSRVIDVEWSVGKGRITPVGIIEPVEIEGITNQRFSLHNSANIREKDVCIGDTVIIERCGEIIPGLKSVTYKPANRIKPVLESCPACGGPVEFDGSNDWCRNSNCSGTLSRQLYDSVVRIGINELGLPTIEKIIKKYNFESLVDILNLTVEQIEQLDGFAAVSAQNLFNEINRVKIKPIEDWRVLASLNISGIGARMSKIILRDISLADLRKMSATSLVELEGVGPVRASLIQIKLQEKDEYLDTLINIFPSLIEMNLIKVNPKKVKGTVCFTGKTPNKGETRSKFWEPFAVKHGYSVSNLITQEITLLVTGDLSSTSSKMKKAQKMGIDIIDYNQFRNRCEAG